MIPKAIRDALHWNTRTTLSRLANASGITLRALPSQPGNSLLEIAGFLRREGKSGIELSTAELCAPLDIDFGSHGNGNTPQ